MKVITLISFFVIVVTAGSDINDVKKWINDMESHHGDPGYSEVSYSEQPRNRSSRGSTHSNYDNSRQSSSHNQRFVQSPQRMYAEPTTQNTAASQRTSTGRHRITPPMPPPRTEPNPFAPRESFPIPPGYTPGTFQHAYQQAAPTGYGHAPSRQGSHSSQVIFFLNNSR